jgi:membrane protease subunit HflK
LNLQDIRSKDHYITAILEFIDIFASFSSGAFAFCFPYKQQIRETGEKTMAWDWEKLNQQQRQQRGGPPPQMDEILKQLKNLKLPGAPLIGIIIIALLISVSMIYKIDQDEVGVVQRFGAFARLEQPGLNFKLPAGIEKVTKVKVLKVHTAEFGFKSARLDPRSRFSGEQEILDVALMLTGDLNIAIVPWIIQFRIKEPADYLFNVRNVNLLLNDMAEASMRLVVGDRSVDEVINRREEIADEAKVILQHELDEAKAGINIVNIEMKRTNVPRPVQPSLNEVNQATQEKEQMIYKANEEYNKAIPAARGEAERIIKTAEGYALDRINRSKGDASRFNDIYQEYIKAKDVTKRRLYLEAMADLLPKLGQKYIVDSDMNNLLPMLNLGKEIGEIK